VVTRTGRVYGWLLQVEVSGTEYLDLADDAAKAAIYRLVTEGFQLVGIAGNEIVVEIANEADASVELLKAETITREAVAEIITGIPVSCSCERRNRW